MVDWLDCDIQARVTCAVVIWLGLSLVLLASAGLAWFVRSRFFREYIPRKR